MRPLEGVVGIGLSFSFVEELLLRQYKGILRWWVSGRHAMSSICFVILCWLFVELRMQIALTEISLCKDEDPQIH